MRDELLCLTEKFGHEYGKLLTEADDTGDFRPLEQAEETFADAILTLLKERVEKVENLYLRAGFNYPPECVTSFERCRKAILEVLK